MFEGFLEKIKKIGRGIKERVSFGLDLVETDLRNLKREIGERLSFGKTLAKQDIEDFKKSFKILKENFIPSFTEGTTFDLGGTFKRLRNITKEVGSAFKENRPELFFKAVGGELAGLVGGLRAGMYGITKLSKFFRSAPLIRTLTKKPIRLWKFKIDPGTALETGLTFGTFESMFATPLKLVSNAIVPRPEEAEENKERVSLLKKFLGETVSGTAIGFFPVIGGGLKFVPKRTIKTPLRLKEIVKYLEKPWTEIEDFKKEFKKLSEIYTKLESVETLPVYKKRLLKDMVNLKKMILTTEVPEVKEELQKTLYSLKEKVLTEKRVKLEKLFDDASKKFGKFSEEELAKRIKKASPKELNELLPEAYNRMRDYFRKIEEIDFRLAQNISDEERLLLETQKNNLASKITRWRGLLAGTKKEWGLEGRIFQEEPDLMFADLMRLSPDQRKEILWQETERLLGEKILQKEIKKGRTVEDILREELDNIFTRTGGNWVGIGHYLKQLNKYRMTLGDKLTAMMKGSLCSALPTHQVNFITTGLSTFTRAFIVHPVATLLRVPFALFSKEQRQLLKGALPYYGGLSYGILKGTRDALNVLIRGYSEQDVKRFFARMAEKWGVREIPPMPARIDMLFNMVFRFLRANDIFFHDALSFSKGAQLAFGETEEKTILDTIKKAIYRMQNDANIIRRADEYGAEGVFAKQPKGLTRWIQRMKMEAGPLGRYIGETLIPFTTVIDNLWNQGFIHYTPLNFVRAVVKRDRLDFFEEISKAIIGTGVLASGAVLYKTGHLILSPPKDKTQRDYFYAQKFQPYSLRIPTEEGVLIVPLSRLEPFVYPLMIGGMIAQAIEEGKISQEEAETVIGVLAREMGKFMADRSYIEGLGRIYDLAFGYALPEMVIPELFQTAVLTWMPMSSFMRMTARLLDPTVKVPNETIGQKVKEMLPGLSREVPARLDIFGNEIERVAGPLGAVFPFAPTYQRHDLVRDELIRLGELVGYPTQPDLVSDEEFRAYCIVYGHELYERLADLMMSGMYWEMSDEERGKAIRRIKRQVREDVREMYFPHWSALKDIEEDIKKKTRYLKLYREEYLK